MSSPSLTVVRHAQAIAEGVCYGRVDVPVQPPPREALELVSWPLVDTVWCSPSLRCRELADAVAAQQRVSSRVDDRLHEMDFGAWEGVAWSDIPPHELEPWMSDWESAAPPGGETVGQLTDRVAAWHAELAGHPHRHLLVAHAGVVRALWVLREGLSWPAAMDRPVVHLQPLEL